jgi:hypothetical protein
VWIAGLVDPGQDLLRGEDEAVAGELDEDVSDEARHELS